MRGCIFFLSHHPIIFLQYPLLFFGLQHLSIHIYIFLTHLLLDIGEHKTALYPFVLTPLGNAPAGTIYIYIYLLTYFILFIYLYNLFSIPPRCKFLRSACCLFFGEFEEWL